MPDFSGREVNDIVPILATGPSATDRYFQTVTLKLTSIISGGKKKERIGTALVGETGHRTPSPEGLRLFLEFRSIPLLLASMVISERILPYELLQAVSPVVLPQDRGCCIE